MSVLAFLGNLCLCLSFLAALYSLLTYPIGQNRNQARLMTSARWANFLSFAFITGAVFCLVTAFVLNDFSIRYIYEHSSRSLPLFYKLTGLWAGLDGSVLFWTWLVSLYAALAIALSKNKNTQAMSIINAVMMIVFLFFLTLIFVSTPFASLGSLPADGRGLNPLLQNVAMVVHPPALYLGFTAFTVPFAFVIAALITKDNGTDWVAGVRSWTLVAWWFLTCGLFLGAAWAYVELGWGGFWAWDPVENTGLLPWLAATACLHSVIVQQKRDLFKRWTVVLVILTFVLTIFGTYLTRSGGVQSVHAFSESSLGPYFIIFILVLLLVSLYLIATRWSWLKSKEGAFSFFSKENILLINNVVLVVAVFVILWGTLFPVLAEKVLGQKISLGPSFFNLAMAPLGLILIILMGVGQLARWRPVLSGHLTHIGVLFVFVGIVGAAFSQTADFSLFPGEAFRFNDSYFVYEHPLVLQDEQTETILVNVTLFKNDTPLTQLKPARRYYFASDQTTTEVDIHLNLWRDVYLILGRYNPHSHRADLRVIINPLMSFVWVGGLMMLLGVAISVVRSRAKKVL